MSEPTYKTKIKGIGEIIGGSAAVAAITAFYTSTDVGRFILGSSLYPPIEVGIATVILPYAISIGFIGDGVRRVRKKNSLEGY